MNNIVFRVDDRLIHGQVIEGWIKKYSIPNVILVNDEIYSNDFQQMIYTSVLPPSSHLSFYSVDLFLTSWGDISKKKGMIMVIFNKIADLNRCRAVLNKDIYINIGCIASKPCAIEVTDTVYLLQDEVDILLSIRQELCININKMPWDKSVDIIKCAYNSDTTK